MIRLNQVQIRGKSERFLLISYTDEKGKTRKKKILNVYQELEQDLSTLEITKADQPFPKKYKKALINYVMIFIILTPPLLYIPKGVLEDIQTYEISRMTWPDIITQEMYDEGTGGDDNFVLEDYRISVDEDRYYEITLYGTEQESKRPVAVTYWRNPIRTQFYEDMECNDDWVALYNYNDGD